MNENNENSGVLSLFVYDHVAVFELHTATSYTFVLMENVSVGYQYDGNGEIDDRVYRAFGLIFEKTLERLEAKGVHLSL